MPSSEPLDDTLGALSIGITLSSILYGINSLQVFLYYTEHSQHDGWFLKSFVALLWVMETLACILLNHGIYYYTVTNFGNYDILFNESIPWSILVEVGISAFIALSVQCFFAHRVYTLSGRRRAVPICIIVLSLAQFALGLVYADVSLSFKRLTGGSSDFPYVISLFSLELIADCIIAVSSIYYLYFKARESDVPSTRRVIFLAIKYVVNTCLLEVFCIVPLIALWTADPEALYFSPFLSCLVRVYSASLMCSLNNRDHLRDITLHKGGVILLSSSYLPPHSSIRRAPNDGASTISRGASEISMNFVHLETDIFAHSEEPDIQHHNRFKSHKIRAEVRPVHAHVRERFAY